jgi:hypothetical protein
MKSGNIPIDLSYPISKGQFVLLRGDPNTGIQYMMQGKTTLTINMMKLFL